MESEVIVVGKSGRPSLIKALGRLRQEGFHVTEAPSAAALPALLKRIPRAAIVVAAPHDRFEEAHRTLQEVTAARRQTPVVIVAEDCDLENYQLLSREGALEFFQFSEQPERIAQGVRWAVQARGA